MHRLRSMVVDLQKMVCSTRLHLHVWVKKKNGHRKGAYLHYDGGGSATFWVWFPSSSPFKHYRMIVIITFMTKVIPSKVLFQSEAELINHRLILFTAFFATYQGDNMMIIMEATTNILFNNRLYNLTEILTSPLSSLSFCASDTAVVSSRIYSKCLLNVNIHFSKHVKCSCFNSN